jgi:hypothetical protein
VLGGSRGSMANNTLTLTLLCPANQAGLITRAQGASSQDIINSGSKSFLSTLTPPRSHSTRCAGYLDRSREYWQYLRAISVPEGKPVAPLSKAVSPRAMAESLVLVLPLHVNRISGTRPW